MKIVSNDVNVESALNLSSKHKIVYSRSSFLPPIINFKLAEELPCINEEEEGYTPGWWFYPLFNVDHENWGCKTSFSDALKFDPRYVFIDKISEEDLYKDNMINLTKLPLFEDYQSKKVTYSLF